ncbi:toll/interleukin-1 receptor domain-containing protein [Nocardioides sp. MH1]|uniref:toll/interleukin-1 receptor domain-containing protein n=1 Tax=Nocardioides sp. MH1 TaxID=3242490 RepID=UPI0035212BA0
MGRRYNPPPNWPKPPSGWTPPPGWKPDPAWGPAPSGWSLWVDSETKPPLRIFISYRRSDCQSQANGLHDGLSHRLRDASIFMDIDSIPAGVDFEQHIRREIETCDVVLVLIGDNWLDPRPGSSKRRIDESNDFVRLEIENALESPRVRTIPVLVEGARMPDMEELPKSIRRLARINAIEMDDMRWKSDLERLSRLLVTVQEQQQSGEPLGSPDVTRVATVVREPAASSRPVAQYAPPPPPPPAVAHSRPMTAPPPPPTAQRSPWQAFNAKPQTGWIAAILPLVTCGLGNFVPLLRAGLLRPHDPRKRWMLIGIGAALEVMAIVSFVVFEAAPTDKDGTPTGPVSGLGMGMIFLFLGTAVTFGIIYRNRPPELDAIEVEMARRNTREHYRRLAETNPGMARSINVGRPDVARALDDAGLVDLNMVSAQTLMQYGRLTKDEADRVVEQRMIAGRFVNVEQAITSAELSEGSAKELRELGVVT